MEKQFYYGKLPENIGGFRRFLISFLSRKADLDGESAKLFEEHREKGAIVFATFQTSNVSLSFLYHLLAKYKFGLLSYAFDYNPLLLQRSSYFLKRLFKSPYLSRKSAFFNIPLVKEIIEKGEHMAFSLLSGAHFLRRYIDPMYDVLYNFIELQRTQDRPVIIIPQMVFWHRKPERKSSFFISDATGKRGFFGAFLSSFSPTYLHFLKPVYLNEFIEAHPGISSEHLAVKLREMLLESHDREKRIVLGPVLTPRQELMEQVLYHENVQSLIRELSNQKGHSVRSLKKESYKIYREIASDFKMSYLRFFEHILDWMLKKMFRGMRISDDFVRTMREAAEAGPVVVVPNHRSHMDYLIISYIFYKNRIMPPHIAAGVNLSFFPLGNLFRHSGAFFIRRTFKDMVLYPAIFKQYLKMLISKNYHIEYFLEGGRSRSGRLLFPKPGLTSFIIEAVEEGYAKDVTFIPISICYDRILEENAYVKEMKGHVKEKETVSAVIGARKFLKKEYGFVYVNNGKPFTLSTINREVPANTDRVAYIGRKIMHEISSVVTVSPFNLVASAMLAQSSRGIKRELLVADFSLLLKYLKRMQVSLSSEFSEQNAEVLVETVIAKLLAENLIEKVDNEGEQTFLVLESERMLFSYYKNPITHYLLPLYLCANVIFRKKTILHEDVAVTASHGCRILLQEFPSMEDSGLSFEPALDFLCEENLCENDRESIRCVESNEAILRRIGSLLQDVMESYYIVGTVLETNGKNAIDRASIFKTANERGRAKFYSEKIRFAEALCQPLFDNALRLFSSQSVIEEKAVSKRKKTIKTVDMQALVKLKLELNEWLV